MQQMIFIADLIACSTCFGHHYAHHQDLESIIQVVAACGIWWGLCVRFADCSSSPQTGHITSAPHHTDNLKIKSPNTTGSNHLYNTLEVLMMGIVVPETCWASNKICNKNHLLHLVGILFPQVIFYSDVIYQFFNHGAVLNFVNFFSIQRGRNYCIGGPAYISTTQVNGFVCRYVVITK